MMPTPTPEQAAQAAKNAGYAAGMNLGRSLDSSPHAAGLPEDLAWRAGFTACRTIMHKHWNECLALGAALTGLETATGSAAEFLTQFGMRHGVDSLALVLTAAVMRLEGIEAQTAHPEATIAIAAAANQAIRRSPEPPSIQLPELAPLMAAAWKAAVLVAPTFERPRNDVTVPIKTNRITALVAQIVKTDTQINLALLDGVDIVHPEAPATRKPPEPVQFPGPRSTRRFPN